MSDFLERKKGGNYVLNVSAYLIFLFSLVLQLFLWITMYLSRVSNFKFGNLPEISSTL